MQAWTVIGWKSQGAKVGAGSGLKRNRVIPHLMREPCKSQGPGVEAGAGLDTHRVVQHLVREPWKS